jgi:hypothetical protein
MEIAVLKLDFKVDIIRDIRIFIVIAVSGDRFVFSCVSKIFGGLSPVIVFTVDLKLN